MRRRGVATVLTAAAAAGVVTVIVVVTTAPGPRSPALPSSGIVADAAVNPQRALFGDTLIARVDVLVDRRRIDPTTLELRGTFSPYTAGPPSIKRQELGHVSRVTHTLRLRCLVAACLPPDLSRGGRRTVSLPGMQLFFSRTDRTRGSLLLELAAVEVASRLSEIDATLIDDFAVVPFQASSALEPISYAVSPSLLVPLLLAAAALLLTGAGWLVLRYGVRRREPIAAPPPEPPVVLSPLERALLVLEQTRARGSVPDERKALELLAGELGRNGAVELAATAQGLAWSAPGPTPAATLTLAADVRSVIERRDGHPH